MAGLHETELTPKPCAGKMVWEKALFSKVKTLTLPSLLAAAKWQPVSGGDHAMRLTEAV